MVFLRKHIWESTIIPTFTDVSGVHLTMCAVMHSNSWGADSCFVLPVNRRLLYGNGALPANELDGYLRVYVIADLLELYFSFLAYAYRRQNKVCSRYGFSVPDPHIRPITRIPG